MRICVEKVCTQDYILGLEFLHFLVRSVSRFEKKASLVLSFCFVSGHDFSRAITKEIWASSPQRALAPC